jgi:hypothetical protein
VKNCYEKEITTKNCYEKDNAMKKKIQQNKIAMKGNKLVVLFFFFLLIGLNSCTDSSPIENEIITTKSIGLRTTLNKIKNSNNIDGRNTSSVSPCFNFIYPINISYNNETIVTVTSFDGLITVVSNENQSLYIDAISFPFQVIMENNVVRTIANENDFQTIIQECGFTTFNNYIIDGPCYDFIYPFSVVNHSNQTTVISNQTTLTNLITANDDNYILDLVYPFSVVKNNQTIEIDNAYQFFEFNDDCLEPCNCDPIDAPVCVQTSSGLLQFQNECIAICAGFSTSDFVSCN